MKIYSKSDVGLKRKENQDSTKYNLISRSCCYAILCDGMGGAKGGSTASSIACDTIDQYLSSNLNENLSVKDISNLMITSIELSNERIFRKSSDDENLQGMGTTCELVVIVNDILLVAHVGDSRVYSIRNNEIMRITEDHSIVQEMVNRGEITEEEAYTHPNKNVITRALGASYDVKIDLIESVFEIGDVILMCSDGLTNFVSEKDIINTISKYKGNKITESLINQANKNGGNDNITVNIIY